MDKIDRMSIESTAKLYNEIGKQEHTVTGFAPRYLLDGTEVTLLPEELRQSKTADHWITDRKLALENSIKSHNYNKKLIDKNRIVR
ncbi:hypothetical protein ACUWC2_28845, partial [Klebsiella pneumoniae]|uniref:hypothetical protein n=1 Tax=Klebsiella pneumoniae TaxID=573 RepID=UPI0040558334